MKITYDIDFSPREAEMLYDLMPNNKLKEYVKKRYIEGETQEVCAKEMGYEVRQIYRIDKDVSLLAVKKLLERVVASEV